MSVFDGLGAAAAIIQFIEYGIKFGNKAIAAYKGQPEFAELNRITDEFQKSTDGFIGSLQIRSTGPDSGEAVLIQIAEECKQHAEELSQLIDGIQMKPEEKSFWNALKMTSKSQMKKNDILAKQRALRQARQRCQEQLNFMIR